MSGKHHETRTTGIAGILLAAGGSHRLGRPKQLVELGGRPLVERAVHSMLPLCDLGLICILGAHADEVRAVLEDCDVRMIFNTDWQEGIGASIRTGIARVPADARAILLSVCDQPLVGTADYAQLVDTWRAEPAAVVAAGYGDGFGVPAIFPAACREELGALRGDRGAKSIIAGARLRRIVEMPDALFDVDDSSDLKRLTGYADRE